MAAAPLVPFVGTLAVPAAPLARANAKYRLAAKAPATTKAYAADWRAFTAWCNTVSLDPASGEVVPFDAVSGLPALVPLPALPLTVAAYLTRLAEGARDADGNLARDEYGELVDAPKKASTINRALASIAATHRAARLPWDPKDPDISETMQGIRHLAADPDQKAPVTKEVLHALVAKLVDRKPLGALRDRALLCVGFIGGFRESELVAVSREDLRRDRRGYVISIRRETATGGRKFGSKTNKEGRREEKIAPRAAGADIPICPMRALAAWLEALDAAGIRDGAVFRAVTQDERIGERLRPPAVAAIVKRATAAAGLDPSIYAGHSLRAGMMTEVGIQKIPVTEGMQQSGHKSVETAMGYMRFADPFDGNAATRILQTAERAATADPDTE